MKPSDPANALAVNERSEPRPKESGPRSRSSSPRGTSESHPIPPHAAEAKELLESLGTSRAGLNTSEVSYRQEEFGPNRLTQQKHQSEVVRFFMQFHQPLLYLLLAASGLTLYVGQWVDASVIFGVVLVNAIVGYAQEAKAEQAIAALARIVVTQATVRREDRTHRIPSEELVPGDMVLLQSGDCVPADLRLLQVRDLQVDESALTGESVPVQKHSDPLPRDTALADRVNLAFSGTLVTHGQAEGVVWCIGDQTETGRIARLITEAVDLSTPLTRKIAQFSKVLLVGILALAAVTFLFGLWRGQPLVEIFMSAVALAVGAVPEGLPAAVTITLAIGVARMARRRAIIRKLPAVETLGSTTVICADKTGTLTENQMTVQQIFAEGKSFTVTGAGYEPHGEISWNDQPVSLSAHPAVRECLQAGLLCNDAQIVRRHRRLNAQGDPTEAALLVAAQKAGLDQQEAHRTHPRLDAIPFSSEHQFMATLHGQAQGAGPVIYLKGAVERLLDRCVDALNDQGVASTLNQEEIRRVAEAMASQGLRVLAFARRPLPSEQTHLQREDVAGELTFLGLQAMLDPPRAEAITAVANCQRAGIRVKMITGDHPLTALAVARQIGLHNPETPEGELHLVTGQDLNQTPQEELGALVERSDVLARVAPDQKLLLVKALQARGHVVAMTGDGVNDAPALKQADIGVAMGMAGTDVAKGAADMMLTDDNFASIEAAVEEGRNVFDNLTKFIVWTLPTNFGQGLVIMAAVFAGVTLPILPVQMLWVNMTTVLLLGLMLVFESKERDLMQRPPRGPKTPIMTFPLVLRIGLVALLMLAGAFGLFLWEQAAWDVSIAAARTTAVNVIVMVLIFYLFNCRSLTRSIFAVGVLSNPWIIFGVVAMILAQLLFTYAPIMNRLFHTAPISGQSWINILGVALAAYAVVGLEKWIRARWTKAHPGGLPDRTPQTTNFRGSS